jgi:hypothetical protein
MGPEKADISLPETWDGMVIWAEDAFDDQKENLRERAGD